MAVNSSEWTNAVLPSKVCQDLCSMQFSNSCSIEKTRLFHAAFQNPEDSSQVEKQYYSPFSLVLGRLVEAESRIIPIGDEPSNTEVKQINSFFHQLRARCFKKTHFLVAHMEAGWLECGPSTVVCWECLNLTSSWDRVYHQGCVLLCHTSPQQSLHNAWHS